jgi:hypothetical protein
MAKAPACDDRLSPSEITKIIRAANTTAARLKTHSATWALKISENETNFLLVRRIQLPNQTRWLFDWIEKKKLHGFIRITATNGLWAVRQIYPIAETGPKFNLLASLTPEYETPFLFPITYSWIAQTELAFATNQSFLENAPVQSRTRSRIILRVPLSDIERQGLTSFIETPPPEAMSKYFRHVLENGRTYSIDLKTGLLCSGDSIFGRAELNEFKFIRKAPGDKSNKQAADAELFSTNRFTNWPAGQTVLVAHDPFPKVRKKRPLLNTSLLNLETGEIRRIPAHDFEGGSQACFHKNRHEIICSGANGLIVPEICKLNLATSSNTVLFNGLFKQPTLSPSGHALAGFLHTTRQISALTIYDFQKNNLRTIGSTNIWADSLAWLPDESGWIVSRQFNARLNTAAIFSLWRVDRDGNSVEIGSGAHPIVLPNTNRVLFRHPSGSWFTCDFDGRDTKPFGNRLTKFDSPVLSPDGKSLLFNSIEKDHDGELWLVDVETAQPKLLHKLKGYVRPIAWR